MRLRIKIVLIFSIVCYQGFGQSKIVDDSTKQVYGAYTTLYQTFGDIKYNKDNLIKIDTLVTGIHNFTHLSNANKYQDLGVYGTARKPVFYEPPTEIGVQSGFDAYSSFYIKEQDIQFFDTKSPFTPISMVIGGKGRALTNVKHTRNINPYWNFGAHYRSIVCDKQVATLGRGDRQVTSTTYYIHSHYQSKTGKYLGLFSLSRMNHKVNENGGLTIDEGAPISDYFDKNVNVNLENAQSSDYRLGFNLYNQFRLNEQLQLYHSLQSITNKNFFTDKPLGTDAAAFDDILINPDSTTDQFQTGQFVNELGLKGDVANQFYNFFVRFRRVKHHQRYLPGADVYNEQSGGFTLRYDFDSTQYVHAGGEYMLDGHFRIGGKYVMKFLAVEYWKSRYKPSIISQKYFGNHYQWSNDFDATGSDFLKGSITYKSKRLKITPFISLTDIRNNVFYGYDKRPVQISGSARIINAGLELDVRFLKNLHFDNEVVYTQISGDSAAANGFRIPQLFINSKLYFGGKMFKETVYVEMGLQGHYKSDYFAKAYDPVTQQFYLQDAFEIPSYLVADAFLDFQIHHVTIFLKYTHANQSINSGYFTTPYYTGQKKVFDFGVRWMFFD